MHETWKGRIKKVLELHTHKTLCNPLPPWTKLMPRSKFWSWNRHKWWFDKTRAPNVSFWKKKNQKPLDAARHRPRLSFFKFCIFCILLLEIQTFITFFLVSGLSFLRLNCSLVLKTKKNPKNTFDMTWTWWRNFVLASFFFAFFLHPVIDPLSNHLLGEGGWILMSWDVDKLQLL